ncbi:hypothetical protein LOC68_12340 [Blastopirellula sp. JC732]|uniref:Secreted protein n=1 Tax=Blastopirellula sediminis TaxID=2894196 RepID=A0A9X1SJY9_9BACT|nr:hypothetical protein [Blastopirellula sediminis]MCC9607518.1 hypothetical protein [Blastopirellula sediminis]MCC9629189.1 hypothetical protein [Blastopirellula sediminis]
MRVASLVSSLLLFAVMLGGVSAEEPMAPVGGGPTAEELKEIAKIRAALGPEFHIASQAFGADVKVPAMEEAPKSESADVLAADSAASTFFSSLTPPSLERAAKFLTLAKSDLHTLSASTTDNTPAEAAELREIEKKCRELADQLERLAKLKAQKATQLR